MYAISAVVQYIYILSTKPLESIMAIRKSIPNETKLRLISASVGHCQKPDCLKPLFPAEIGGDKYIAQIVHVILHGDTESHREKWPAEEFELISVL